MRELDLRNKNCPIPLIETRKFINEHRNEDFNIILNNKVSVVSIKKFLENNMLNYSSNRRGEDYVFEVIFDGNDNLSSDKFQINNLSILVMSELFGNGDESLSRMLMKSYFYSLTESITFPSNIIFINSGVKLLTKDGGILNSIEHLKNRGVSLFACGTCVDYYGLKDLIKYGEITNMYVISEILNNSDSVIRI